LAVYIVVFIKNFFQLLPASPLKSTVIEAMPGMKFGCDPELFVLDKDGEYVTAEGLIPGTKEEPYPVPFGAVQVDGMAAEFNIDPATTFEEFRRNVTEVKKTLKKMLPKGYSLSAVPAVTFSERAWAEAPDNAKILGCTPDFNAWTGDVNPPPNCEADERLRTASGHLHIGWTEGQDPHDLMHMSHCRDLVKQLDWYLGGWSTKKDPDLTRRKLYGKAGAMRFKPYGTEYRVLSNFWLTTKGKRFQVWNRMNRAIHDMRTSFYPDDANTGIGKKYEFNRLLVESINKGTIDQTLQRYFRFPLTGDI